MESSKKSAYTAYFSKSTQRKLKRIQSNLEFNHDQKISINELISSIVDQNVDQLMKDPTTLIDQTSRINNIKNKAS